MMFFEHSKMDEETLCQSNKKFRVFSSTTFTLLVLNDKPFKPEKVYSEDSNRFVTNTSKSFYREVMLMEPDGNKRIFFPEKILNDPCLCWLKK